MQDRIANALIAMAYRIAEERAAADPENAELYRRRARNYEPYMPKPADAGGKDDAA